MRGGAASLLLHSGVQEGDVLPCQLAVDSGEGLQLVLALVLVLTVKVALEELGAVDAHTQALANDLVGVHDVLQDGVVHSCEGAAAGPLLHLLPVLAAGSAEDAALGNNHDVLAAELLLELAYKTGLDAVVGLQQAVGDKQHNSLLVVADLDLLGGQEGKVAELRTQLGGVHLQIKEGLGHLLLEGRGRLALLLDDLLACCEHAVML
mmetsp:Transcript_13430/g.34249  ORF Transcript_13430/g.34249 Transcript_13430/m.34249 type:complete len:207 (-) Transcript_13430:78-698(-)